MTANERDVASRVLRAMGHPVRLGILDVLRDGPKTVTELFQELGCTQSSMSLQLQTLEASGLVSSRREGAFKHCTLRNRDVLNMMECLRLHLHTYLTGRGLDFVSELETSKKDSLS
ncbi:MAG: helix-turn-helix transcriptional regulator [Lentisphaeria bacterium]|nr:helix-turn-helix transcriptional regulator [Lentisphaeria bacterium]